VTLILLLIIVLSAVLAPRSAPQFDYQPEQVAQGAEAVDMRLAVSQASGLPASGTPRLLAPPSALHAGFSNQTGHASIGQKAHPVTYLSPPTA
jgi:hypothetical protein